MIFTVTAKEWTVRRMTDNEIIKALECCSTGETYADCEKNGCPLYLGIIMGCKYINKENQLYADALGIINRLKAEIEKLKGSTIVSNIMESQRIKREAKAEAYKEFAEIIKDKWFDNRYDSPDVDFDDFISNLLKEMVGEKE